MSSFFFTSKSILYLVSILRRVMAGESLLVTLRNVEFGERLYAETDEYAKDFGHRSVYTNQNQNETGPAFLWNMTAVFAEGTFRVRLARTLYAGEKLFAPLEKVYMKDSKRRYTYTFSDTSDEPETTSADWFIESDLTDPIPNPNRYVLKSVLYGQYLFAEDSNKARDDVRRNVFTFAGKDKQYITSTQKHLWDIALIESPVCE